MNPDKRIQCAKDYEVLPSKSSSKAIVPNPITPQKSNQRIQNRFSPLQNRPEIPYNTVLASNLPRPANVQIPNSPEIHKYTTKGAFEDCGLAPFTEFPQTLSQSDFIRNRFPNPAQLWEADDPSKDQKYYELVLIDSNSVEISHTLNKSKEVEFSKCIFKKILTLTAFGGNQHDFKTFSVNHPAQGYNYIDYKNAWFRAFLLRPFNHSWFFSFHPKSDKSFPIWFIDWWQKFGSSTQILPNQVQKGFNVFAELSTLQNYQKFIMFHAEFKIPWIFAWDFYFEKIFPDPTLFSLTRVFKIKWWAKFQEHLGAEPAVRHFLTTGQKIVYQKEQTSGKSSKKASSSKAKEESSFTDLSDNLKREFFEYLAQNLPLQDQNLKNPSPLILLEDRIRLIFNARNSQRQKSQTL